MIFGSDNREKVAVRSSELARYGVQIVAHFSDGSTAQGSGVMVGINDVLTAAHVLYNMESGGYAEYIEVTPARDGAIKPYGVAYGAEAVVSQQWINNKSYSGDWGLITLDSAIGKYTGYVDIESYQAHTPLNEVFSIGYPGDLRDGESLYYVDGSVDSIDSGELLFYDDMDAYPGQSGSGIFVEEDGKLSVVGIISYESYSDRNHNAALGISTALKDTLGELIGDNDESVTYITPIDGIDRGLIEKFDLMYNSFFGRSGSREELDSVLDIYNLGVSLGDIAKGYYNYAVRNGYDFTALDNRAFITYVFENVLEIDYTEAYINHWVKIQNESNDIALTRGDILYRCAIDESFVDSHALVLYNDWHLMYEDLALSASGNDESEILSVTSGDSVLMGYGGNDTISGGGGADYLWGGSGTDILTGGGGSDFFAFGAGDGIDSVSDFSVYSDKIRVRGDNEWRFVAGNDGNLWIVDSSGTNGLKLIGISTGQTNLIGVIDGELV